jgi:hypothetical protein
MNLRFIAHPEIETWIHHPYCIMHWGTKLPILKCKMGIYICQQNGFLIPILQNYCSLRSQLCRFSYFPILHAVWVINGQFGGVSPFCMQNGDMQFGDMCWSVLVILVAVWVSAVWGFIPILLCCSLGLFPHFACML